MERYSCGGRAAGKNKGKRAIVVGAIAEDGVIPECTKVVVSGMRDLDGDYHKDMNSDLFEMWLTEAIPHMIRRANGKRVSLVVDNAPYHSRQLEKIPTTSSTKNQIREYLGAHGVTVPENATKAGLLKQVKERTIQWMATVSTELAVGWFREAMWHESQAREKEAIDIYHHPRLLI
ncbi:unnamed protein product [Cylicocyclus nassatus]|uniref:Tc1-like transposase DDE domain-containing protein n=1 Tax=Cylicocyclus nassatus TaxID=53992 RepID=A0AA36GFY0_CYLNA|nr:unnamed protein product [Cylicocyclus nassatus]